MESNLEVLMAELLKDDTNTVRFPVGRQCQVFNSSSTEHCRILYRLLMKDFNLLFHLDVRKQEIVYGTMAGERNVFKPLILLSKVDNCVHSNAKIAITESPSYSTVYTTAGSSVAAMF